MENFEVRSVVPDSRNRIALGDLAKGVSRFDVIYNNEDDTIVLKPYVDIPRHELWVYQNPEILAGIEQGLKEAIAENFVPLPPELQKDIDDQYKNTIDITPHP